MLGLEQDSMWLSNTRSLDRLNNEHKDDADGVIYDGKDWEKHMKKTCWNSVKGIKKVLAHCEKKNSLGTSSQLLHEPPEPTLWTVSNESS